MSDPLDSAASLPVKIYFDGGCRPNPGSMETAVVVRGSFHYRADAGTGTSEQAEWLALLDALDIAQGLGHDDILLLGDSTAVIDQAVNGARCSSLMLRENRERFEHGAQAFHRLRLRHIKRSQNLAGIALGQLRQGRRVPRANQQERT